MATQRLMVLAHVALCAVLVWLYPLGDGLLHPRRAWAGQANAAGLSLLLHLAVYAGLFVNTLLIARAATQKASRYVWLAWGASSLVLLFAFPGESADVFDYLFRGRMMVEYGYSPLVTTPSALQQFPFHRYVSWSQWVDAYGPLWEYASAGLSMLVRLTATPAEQAVTINQTCDVQAALCSYLTKYITAYRLFSILLTGGCGWLIGRWVEPERKAGVQAAFLVNPLTLISTAVGAHNEPLLILFMLLAVDQFRRAALQRRHDAIGFLMLLCAAHIKLTALVVLPVLAVWLLRERGWRYTVGLFVGMGGIGLAISWLLYAPLGGWATLPQNLYERSLLSANSWGELLYLGLRQGAGWPRVQAQQLVARLAPALFMLISLPLLWRWLRARSAVGWRVWSEYLGQITLLYLFVGSFWFQPWYLMWPLGLFSVGRSRSSAAMRTLQFGLAALGATLLADYLRAAQLPLLASWQISLTVVLLIFITPALMARWSAVIRYKPDL